MVFILRRLFRGGFRLNMAGSGESVVRKKVGGHDCLGIMQGYRNGYPFGVPRNASLRARRRWKIFSQATAASLARFAEGCEFATLKEHAGGAVWNLSDADERRKAAGCCRADALGGSKVGV